MRIFFEQKKPGRVRQTIEPVALDITIDDATVGGLIAASVRSCVDAYNKKITSRADDTNNRFGADDANKKSGTNDFDRDSLHPAKTAEEIEDMAETGKVAFGFIYNGKPVDAEAAVANALQCYEDGFFRVFLNGTPLGDANEKIEIKEDDTLTVVRLTMLAGRLW